MDGGGKSSVTDAVFVTGGASGIGRAVAAAFVAGGAPVVIADRDGDLGRAAVAELEAEGASASFVECDITEEAQVKAAVESCASLHGGLRHAVNCAGIVERTGTPFADYETAQFDALIGTTLRGTFLSMKYELGAIEAAGGGTVVNIASGAGLVGVPGIAGYIAAKHGVVGLTKVGALDYAAKGIRVNAICPGVVDTPMTAHYTPEERQAVTAGHPIGRIGTAAEMADAVLWLSSPASSFVTGVALPVDGGWTIP
jgi:NAD(P)-dependent dehydrogenase (short-subunit alcohol dehydrogenase family)